MTSYKLPMFPRLEPSTPWRGGRLADIDVLTLEEAARFASKHANTDITPADFLRAASRGEILLRAVCPRTVTMQPCRSTEEPFLIPETSIPTLPLDACRALANVGSANWRTIDSFEPAVVFGGLIARFTCWQLPDDEPDLVSTPTDCRVTGRCVHALADAFIDAPLANQSASKQAAAIDAPESDEVTDTTGMVAWQADVIENKEAILNEYGNAVSARSLMLWCRTKGSTDVFKRDQPKVRGSIQWTDGYGDVHTVTIRTIGSQLSLWRKQGVFPKRK